jgi:hypothetical protein
MEISDDVFMRHFLFSRTLMFMMINMNNTIYHMYHGSDAEKYNNVPDDEVAHTPLTF